MFHAWGHPGTVLGPRNRVVCKLPDSERPFVAFSDMKNEIF